MENTGDTLDSGIAGSSVLPQLLQNPNYTHLPISAKRFDVKRIENNRNLSAIA